jgi:transposase
MMTFSDRAVPVYLHRQPIDFRLQINGLSLIVQNNLLLDPFSAALFAFTNRSRNRIKILYWSRNGFCLWLKRLEKDKFVWPRSATADVVTLSTEELSWLLEGFDIWRQPPHQRLQYCAVG